MSQVAELVFDLEYEIHKVIRDLPCVNAEQLGLDYRAASTVWIDDDALIVLKSQDRTLQYYGGFEYIDSEYRMEVGKYVIYTSESSRVRDCFDCYEESLEEA